jgi:methylated-DNA-[protein]-cysteine S-methyltransferase
MTDYNKLIASLKVGTTFQKKVWIALTTIPKGEVRTYGELAKMIGSPGASRAIGNACNKNPLPIIIPCHRVVASNHIGGYRYGAELKKALLSLEGYEQ